MNEFALECKYKYKYNWKYCSTKSSLPNLHENGITSLWMNLLWNVNINVSIDHVNLAKKILLNNTYSLFSDNKLPLVFKSGNARTKLLWAQSTHSTLSHFYEYLLLILLTCKIMLEQNFFEHTVHFLTFPWYYDYLLFKSGNARTKLLSAHNTLFLDFMGWFGHL